MTICQYIIYCFENFYKIFSWSTLEQEVAHEMVQEIDSEFVKDKGLVIYKSKNTGAEIYLYENHTYKFFSPKNGTNSYKNIISELSRNKHRNILLPDEIFTLPTNNSLMETNNYYEYDLLDYVQNFHIDYENISNFTLQILEGINHMHTKCKIAHRDIKPENILICKRNDISSDRNNIILKIIDLDFAIDIYNTDTFRGGSYSYASPQLLDQNVINQNWIKNDIWSVGIVIYIILFGMFPWKLADSNEDTFYLKYIDYVNTGKIDEYWLNVFKSFHKNKKKYYKFLHIIKNSLLINEDERASTEYLLSLLEL